MDRKPTVILKGDLQDGKFWKLSNVLYFLQFCVGAVLSKN